MMGSCAFLMPLGSLRFIRKDAYSLRPARGWPSAAYRGSCSPRSSSNPAPRRLRWLVIVVVVYTAVHAALRLREAVPALTLARPPSRSATGPPAARRLQRWMRDGQPFPRRATWLSLVAVVLCPALPAVAAAEDDGPRVDAVALVTGAERRGTARRDPRLLRVAGLPARLDQRPPALPPGRQTPAGAT